MRVLHLTTEYPPVIYGGLGTAIGGLARASVRAGMTAAVLLAGEPGPGGYGPPSLEQIGRARVDPGRDRDGVHLFYAADFMPVEAGVRLVREWRPDVVHLHVFWLWPVARAIQRLTGTPLVYHVHSLDRAEYEVGHGPRECLDQWATQEEVIDAADRIIALTESERRLLAEYCPRASGRVRVVGNGIDESAVARAAVMRSRHTDSPVVLYTGRFVERKGIRELLDAVPRVLERAPSTHFVLAGGHRGSTGEQTASYWLPPTLRPYSSRIRFTGWLSPAEVARWYARAEILAVPSWYEPFGMVVLEGMLYGIPIVAADVGGPAEILSHDRTGLLCAPRDAAGLADALVRLVADEALRTRLGVAGAREVRRTWLWPSVIRKVRAVYDEAVEDRCRALPTFYAGHSSANALTTH